MFYRKYEASLDYHRQALTLSPHNASTYSAMGYVYMLSGRYMAAVEYYHKALGLRRDDTFSTTMLGYSIEHLLDDDAAFANSQRFLCFYEVFVFGVKCESYKS